MRDGRSSDMFGAKLTVSLVWSFNYVYRLVKTAASTDSETSLPDRCSSSSRGVHEPVLGRNEAYELRLLLIPRVFDLRFGINNSVYKRQEMGTTSTGSFASVMKVKGLHSQKIFAAKVPHFKSLDPASKVRGRWESLTKEFQRTVKLQHVGDSRR